MPDVRLGIYLGNKTAIPSGGGGGGSGITGAMPDALLYLASSPGTDDDFQIAFTDAGANTSYTVAISIDSTGILTYNNTTSLTGSGSGTNTTSYSGSKAALEGKTITVSGLTDEVATITWSITGDQDAEVANGTFAVGALPDLETANIAENVESGYDFFPGLTTALSGSAATVASSQTIYDRPIIMGMYAVDNGDQTIDIVIEYELGTGTLTAGDDIFYVVTTDTTKLSGGASTETEQTRIIAGQDLTGTTTAVKASGSQALSGTGTQTIAGISGTLAQGDDVSVLVLIEQDDTDGTDALVSAIDEYALTIADQLTTQGATGLTDMAGNPLLTQG